MVRSLKVIFGIAAVSLTCGAAQLASGGDLGSPSPVQTVAASVNRAAKSDRMMGRPVTVSEASTVSIRSTNVADTSIVVRLPNRAAVEKPRVPFVTARKTTLACEPVVSVLTDVAKHLEPGRCVT
jgi:hypothetical protein